jgi:hypothetical protein
MRYVFPGLCLHGITVNNPYLSGFYETAGGVNCFSFFLVRKFFCFLRLPARLTWIEDSSRTSIRTLNESGTRCLLGSDEDELGLLSKARPWKAQPLNAVTQTRDGFAGCNAFTSVLD